MGFARGIRSLWRSPLLVMGFAFQWGIGQSCIGSNALFLSQGFSRFANDSFNLSYALSGFTFLIILLLITSRVASVFTKRSLTVASLATALGLLLVPLSSSFASGLLPSLGMCLAGALCGFGTAFMQIGFLEMITRCDYPSPGVHIVAGFFVGNCVSLLMTLIPFPWATGTALLLCLASFYCILREKPKRETFPFASGSHRLGSALLAILTPLLCAFALEVVFVIVSQISLSRTMGFADANRTFILTMIVSSLSTLCLFLIRPMSSNPTRIYTVIYPLIATGLIFLPLFGDLYSIALTLIIMAVSHFANIIVYSAVVETASRHKVSVSFLSGVTFGAIQIAVLIGIVVGSQLIKGDFLEPVRYLLITMASLYILSMIMVFLIRLNRKEPTRQQQVENEDGGKVAEEPLLTHDKHFASRYRFTKRETEVFSYLLNGRTSSYIGKSLFLSLNTVKGHIKNIYLKTDVHTKQELIDRFEAERAQDDTEYDGRRGHPSAQGQRPSRS